MKNNIEEKKLLFIVHDFPPMGGGAVIRALKFVKYLPRFGWAPIILTLAERYYDQHLLDTGLLSELPQGIRVCRTSCLKPPCELKQRLKQIGVWKSRHSRPPIVRLKRNIQSRFLVFQDEGFLWWPFALSAALRVIREQSIRLIYTTVPPHNVALLGLVLKAIVRVPWVVDFRDGWTDDALFKANSALRNMLERLFEKQVVLRADRIVVATDQIDNWFYNRYGDVYRAKGSIIYNGFDPADFEKPLDKPGRCKQDRTLHIVYTGSAGGPRTVRFFLEAIKELHESIKINVEFIGTIHGDEHLLAAQTPGVTVTPHIAHQEAVEKMRHADVLLLVNAIESRDALTGKLFEYLAACRPILALTGPGHISELIQSNNLGLVTPVDDKEAIKTALSELYKRFVTTGLPEFGPGQDLIQRYDRRRLTGQLAQVFDEVTNSGAPSYRGPV